ncbi:MAG: hypothetical protein H7X80_04625 [bacterium]|nr:hypothetical protein [Candidatus Kapabacteria bacterium]
MRTTNKHILPTLALIVACALSSCLFPISTYRYDFRADGAVTQTRLARDVTIAFEPIEVDEAYDREQFVVRAPEGEMWWIETFRWIDVPSAFATAFAIERADRIYSNDQVTGNLDAADYVVRAQVLEMAINIDESNVPISVRTRIDVTVVRAPYGRAPTVVLSHVISKTAQVADYRHENVPVAIGRALDTSIAEVMSAIGDDAKAPNPPQGITLLATADDGSGTDIVMSRDSNGDVTHVQLERGHQGYRQGTVAATTIDGYNATFTFAASDVPRDNTTPTSGSLRMHDGMYTMRLTFPTDGVLEYRVFSPNTSTIATWVRSLDEAAAQRDIARRRPVDDAN